MITPYAGEIYTGIYNDIKNKLCFDLGSNIGQICKRLTSHKCKVIAVEPQKNLTVGKNYKDVFAIKNVCVGDKVGHVTFNKCSHHSTSSCLPEWKRYQPNKKWTKVKVPMITVDNLIEEYGVPKYIKIDVEGLEDKVLIGLSSKVDIITFEFVEGYTDCAIRCYDILQEKFGIKTIKIFVKNKIKRVYNGIKISKGQSYTTDINNRKELVKYMQHFSKVVKVVGRNVGDILVTL